MFLGWVPRKVKGGHRRLMKNIAGLSRQANYGIWRILANSDRVIDY
jgi:hypothetical protein